MTSTSFEFLTERVISDIAAAHALFFPIAGWSSEVAAFAYLDPKWRLLGMRHTLSGARDAVDIPVRAVAADALALDAAGVVMAHNHPSGDATPSDADQRLTARLSRALDALGVRLVDHLIFAGDDYTSFSGLGLL